MAEIQTTKLSRGWLTKLSLFLIAALVLGVWGLMDAAVFYPRSGDADSSFKLKQYLESAKAAGRLSQAKVADGSKEFADLQARRTDLARQAIEQNAAGRSAAMDLARLEWLESLKNNWKLAGAAGRITDPEQQLQKLTAEWKTRSAPKPLSPFDLPTQWLIASIGLVIATGVVFLMLRRGGNRYTWDPDAKRLTLPDGQTLTPGDIREFDKRKWHKFFVTIVRKDGGSHKLDLLRYSPLEDWVLELERIAFPESALPKAADEATTTAMVPPDDEEPRPPL